MQRDDYWKKGIVGYRKRQGTPVRAAVNKSMAVFLCRDCQFVRDLCDATAISEGIPRGAMELQVIPCSPSSAATERAKPASPLFDAA